MISISVYVQILSEFYSTSQWKSVLSFYKRHNLLKHKKTQKFTLACFHLHEVLAQVQLIDSNKNHRSDCQGVSGSSGKGWGETADNKETLSGENTLYLDWGGGHMGVRICQNSLKYTLRKKSVHFIALWKLYLNEAYLLKKHTFRPRHLIPWHRRQRHTILQHLLEALLISNPMIFKFRSESRLSEHNLRL